MEEETIFQGNNANPPQDTEPVPEPVQVTSQQAVEPQVAAPPVEPVPQQPQNPPAEVSSPAAPPIPQDHEDGFPIKKLLFVILGIIILLAVVVGIFSLLSSRKSNQVPPKRVLSYWGVNEDPEYMSSVIADFEKTHPEIKISYEKQDISNYREKLSVRIPKGTGPDVYSFHNTWLPQIQKDLAPLPSSVITKEQFTSNYYPSAQVDLMNNGQIYGIPLQTDTLALYINPQIFSAAETKDGTTYDVPKTWQDFIKISAKLTERNDQGKIIVGGAGIGPYDNVEHASDIISLLFAQNGVDFEDLASSTKKVDDALTFYTNFALFENNVYDSTLDNTLKAFADGKLAMYFGYSSDYFKIKQLNPDLNFEITPAPQLLNEDQVNLTSYWAEGVSSKSTQKTDAMLFMKYLTKPEVQEKLFQEQTARHGFGLPYSNKNLATKLDGTPFKVFVDQADTAVSSPFSSNTFDNGLNDKSNALLQGLVNGILNGQNSGSPAEALSAGILQIMGEINGTKPMPTP